MMPTIRITVPNATNDELLALAKLLRDALPLAAAANPKFAHKIRQAAVVAETQPPEAAVQ